MSTENTTATPMEEELLVDQNAMSHKRIIEQQLNNIAFEFHWTRMDVSELLYVLVGKKETPNDSSVDGLRRMLLKTVDASQKGLLLDLLNDRANYTLARNLISGMLPLITDNATSVDKPKFTQTGDVKQFTVYLITDGEPEWFDFKTDRNRFDEFQLRQEDILADQAGEVFSFLHDALEDKGQRQRFRLLHYDERNFTLSSKLYAKVSSFLARNQAITTKPTLKK